MKRLILNFSFWLIALLSFSQEGIKYKVRLESIYESEFDTLIYEQGKEHYIIIYDGYIATCIDSVSYYDSINERKELDGLVWYELKTPFNEILWLTVYDDRMKLKFKFDPNMIYWYKILSYEKVY